MLFSCHLLARLCLWTLYCVWWECSSLACIHHFFLVPIAISVYHIMIIKWCPWLESITSHIMSISHFIRGFKALKQTVKIYYRLGKYKEMMESYREMLTYIKSAVTRNYSEKCINSIMDYVSGSASQNFGLLQEFYQTTLKALEEAKNEVRW